MVLFEVLVFIARIQIHTSDAFQYLALGLCPLGASVGLVGKVVLKKEKEEKKILVLVLVLVLSASVGLVDEVVLKKEKEEKKIARNTAIAPQSMYYPPLILAGAPKRVLVTSRTQ